MAHNEARRISHLDGTGRLRVWNSQTILLRAAGSTHLPHRTKRPLDAALPPISETDLLTHAIWDEIEAAQQ